MRKSATSHNSLFVSQRISVRSVKNSTAISRDPVVAVLLSYGIMARTCSPSTTTTRRTQRARVLFLFPNEIRFLTLLLIPFACVLRTACGWDGCGLVWFGLPCMEVVFRKLVKPLRCYTVTASQDAQIPKNRRENEDLEEQLDKKAGKSIREHESHIKNQD